MALRRYASQQPPGSDTQAVPSGMTEDPVTTRVTEASPYTPRPSTVEGTLQ